MPTNIVLDATMLDTFLSCPAKFNYRFNLNKVPTVKAVPLDRGSLFHTGMEVYYANLHTLGYEKALDLVVEKVRESAVTESDLPVEEWQRIIDVILEHCEVWRHKDEAIEVIAVEQPFSYVLFENEDYRIIMIGKIDLLINDGEYKNLPVDHKTYTRESPLHRTANQFSNYAFACQSNYLRVNRVGLQTSIKPALKHKRIMLTYDPLYLQQWRQNVISWCMNYVDCALNRDWPMNFTSCDKYNRLCEYHEVCNSSGQSAKLFKLESNFMDAEPWDVSKSLKNNND